MWWCAEPQYAKKCMTIEPSGHIWGRWLCAWLCRRDQGYVEALVEAAHKGVHGMQVLLTVQGMRPMVPHAYRAQSPKKLACELGPETYGRILFCDLEKSWRPQVTPEQIASAVHEEVAANEAKLRAERCVRMQHCFSALSDIAGFWG